MHSHSHNHSHDHSHHQEHQMHQQDIDADKQQKRHQKQVKSAFINYRKDMKASMECLYEQQKLGKYFQLVRQRKRVQMDKALQANQNFLNMIVQSTFQNTNMEIGDGIQGQNDKFEPDGNTKYHNISKIRTTVKQFFRQWCKDSPQIQDYMYIVEIVKKYIKTKSRIVVPGCGLARLPLQLIEAGYDTQGNQVTYFMLYGSNFILNCAQKIQQFQIFPFIHSLSHHQRQEDMFRSVLVPDKLASQAVPQDADFSMAAGQFTQIYENNEKQFDGVVTCFFIDTANNVFQYIDTIYKILKNDAIWVNYGPLMYHFKDMLDQVSVQLSWEQVKAYGRLKGFILLEENKRQTTYCHDPLSTYKHIYEATLTVWQKKQPKPSQEMEKNE